MCAGVCRTVFRGFPGVPEQSSEILMGFHYVQTSYGLRDHYFNHKIMFHQKLYLHMLVPHE